MLTHLERHTHPAGKDVYTAIFATDKIQTLMRYYRYMKTHNPKGYKIAAIFTYRPNEDMDEGANEYSGDELKECMKDYGDMFGTNYDLDTLDAYRKDIAKRMKQKELPQIDLLLVVDMFLTGFDSKATTPLFWIKRWYGIIFCRRIAARTESPSSRNSSDKSLLTAILKRLRTRLCGCIPVMGTLMIIYWKAMVTTSLSTVSGRKKFKR